MKTLLLSFFISFLACACYCQEVLDLYLLDMDSVIYNGHSNIPLQGDSAILYIRVRYQPPKDLSNPFKVTIGDSIIFNGSFGDFLKEGLSIHIKLPSLGPKDNSISKYNYPVKVNGITEINILLYPKDVITEKRVLFVSKSSDTLSPDELPYVNIRFDYIGQFNCSDSLKIQIYSPTTYQNLIVFSESFCKLNQRPRNPDGSTKIIFTVPDTTDVGEATLYIAFSNSPQSVFIKRHSSVESILNPLKSNIKIFYFDILGNKIEKPTEGLYVWISENGESGKIFIVN